MIFLVGNWKMAPEKPTLALDLTKKTAAIAKQYKKTVSTIVCPPFIYLSTVVKAKTTALEVAAQSVAPTVAVASTGLVSAGMIKSAGVAYSIVGHSESRARGENNIDIAEQTARLLEKKIRPIICVGEKDRDSQGWYLSEIKEQLEVVFAAIPKTSLKQIMIAYEPVWAIGKDAIREATPAECREMVIFIRKVINDTYGEKVAAAVPILYGGSVNEVNASSFITEGDAQGLLVGRVSLEPKRFGTIAKSLALISLKKK